MVEISKGKKKKKSLESRHKKYFQPPETDLKPLCFAHYKCKMWIFQSREAQELGNIVKGIHISISNSFFLSWKKNYSSIVQIYLLRGIWLREQGAQVSSYREM